MSTKLVQQLTSWNPWWETGMRGMDESFRDPEYKRELYESVYAHVKKREQIVSIVGLRQVGKSTMMRQIIRDLLQQGVDPHHILYVSFEDPFLKTSYSDNEVFESVIGVYMEEIVKARLGRSHAPLYFFFDEIHQLPQWEKMLKSYYDRNYDVMYMVSGSSSLHLQTKNRESLLGRINEYTLWPFSFREYVAYHESKNSRELFGICAQLGDIRGEFLRQYQIGNIFPSLQEQYKQLAVRHKQEVINYLREYILMGGFPRVWQHDFPTRQKFLWEQYVSKVIFEDLLEVAHLRKPQEVVKLLARIIAFTGEEVSLTELRGDLNIRAHVTLDKYINYLLKTFLIFRIERSKSKKFAIKRRAGQVKFYISNIALRNAYYNRDERVYFDSNEMGIIAENMVLSCVGQWLSGAHNEYAVSYYRDGQGEVDLIVKDRGTIIPIEVKWRNNVPRLKTLDKLCKKWDLEQSILVTKDFDLAFKSGRLSVPLWFFLLGF